MAEVQFPFEVLLNNNDEGLIEKPLRRVDDDDLTNDIKEFHRDQCLGNTVGVDTLIRGGLLAKDEEATTAKGILNEEEIAALDKERSTTIWQESKELKIILVRHFQQDISSKNGCLLKARRSRKVAASG